MNIASAGIVKGEEEAAEKFFFPSFSPIQAHSASCHFESPFVRQLQGKKSLDDEDAHSRASEKVN
jgi:hypothetical protein